MCKLRSILEVDFLNKLFLIKLRSILEVYFVSRYRPSINQVPFYVILFLYFIYTSFWEVYLKYTSSGLQGSEV